MTLYLVLKSRFENMIHLFQVSSFCIYEDLHDMVHTYVHMILPHPLVSFLYGAV